MELKKAIQHLEEIHAQVSRTEFYRGISAITVALTGICGLLAAALQHVLIDSSNEVIFVLYWASVAAVNVVGMGAVLYWRHINHSDFYERLKTQKLLLQFVPALIGGALLTFIALESSGDLINYLPGLWCLLFSLGIFACQPFYPARLFWAGLYYLSVATMLLMLALESSSLTAWIMGLSFGIGQLGVAGILYWDLERYER